MKEENIFKVIKLNKDGLIPAIAQDVNSGEVLMMAFMNKESLKLTLEKKTAHYYSRSRQKIWKKGEKSNQIQYIEEVFLDCDNDCILLKVKQKGKPFSVSCHTGRKNCFFKKVNEDGNLTNKQKILIKEEELYDKR